MLKKTHPVYASLDHPLFAFGEKREWKADTPSALFSRSEERADERSNVWVSKTSCK